MRIFLTGGTGYIGSAVVDALVRGGHVVDALVRNSEKAAQVRARGGRPVIGDLAKPASFADALAAADGQPSTNRPTPSPAESMPVHKPSAGRQLWSKCRALPPPLDWSCQRRTAA